MRLSWIFGNFQKDILLIYVPTIVALLIPIFSTSSSNLQVIYAFLVLALIDSGHGYISVFRFQGNNRPKDEKKKALLLFLAIFAGISFGQYVGIPYMFTAFIYFTIYHHIKQYFGLQKWYEKINQFEWKLRSVFLWSLTITPAIIFHLRPEVQAVREELSLLSISDYGFLLSPLRAAYYFTISIWLAFELRILLRNRNSLPAFLLMLQIVAAHFLCFNFGDSLQEAIFPLLVAHGFTYFALINMTNTKVIHLSLTRSLALLATVAIVFGGLDFLVSDLIVSESLSSPILKILMALAVGFTLTPNVWHYIVDASLWKRSDPDMKAIIS